MFSQLMPNPTQLHTSQPEGLNDAKLTTAAMRRRMGVGYIEVGSAIGLGPIEPGLRRRREGQPK
jgi:hypothetical protein